jgi:hypothetical protein
MLQEGTASERESMATNVRPREMGSRLVQAKAIAGKPNTDGAVQVTRKRKHEEKVDVILDEDVAEMADGMDESVKSESKPKRAKADDNQAQEKSVRRYQSSRQRRNYRLR